MPLFPVEIEGPIRSVAPEGTGAVMQVMGLTVSVTVRAADARRVVVPDIGQGSRALSMLQLLSAAPLPGRTSPGFVGGTAIVTGNFNSTTGRIEVDFPPTPPADQGTNDFEQHPKLEIGPPESLILGPITASSGGAFSVNGVAITRLDETDGRLVGLPPRNEFGFDLQVTSIQPGMPASVDGYPEEADPTKFRGLDFVVDSLATVLVNPAAQVSILRASGRNRGAEFDIDIRGGAFVPGVTAGSQRIEVNRIDVIGGVSTERNLGTAQARMTAGGFGKWRLSIPLTVLSPPYDVAPATIVARNIDVPSRPSATVTDVDVRDG